MKDVRLAAFDLDGTLLDSANKISDFTIRQIQKAIDRGIEIVIATGRSVPLFPEELKRVSGIRYAIVENGAGIYDLKNQRFLFRRTIPYDIVRNRRLSGGGRRVCRIFSEGNVYSDIENISRLNQVDKDDNFVSYFRQNHTFVNHLKAQDRLLENIEKINLFFVNQNVQEKIKMVLKEETEVSATSSIADNIAHKSMSSGYVEVGTTYQEWTQTGTNSDFKLAKRYLIYDAMAPGKIPEGGEFSYSELQDASVGVQLATYGDAMNFSVNDDQR